MNKIFFTISYFLFFTINAQNPHFDISKQMEIYNDMLKILSTNYIDEINFGDKIQESNTKMLNSLDRFTTFYDEEGILLQKMRQAGHYGGLGIAVQIKDSLILITKIFKDTPAAKYKLHVGDKILAVDGKYIYELDKKVVSNLLRGNKGSKVKLLIERNDKQITKSVERDEVPLNAVTATELIGDIGYIRFVKFNQKASSQTKKAILFLKSKGAKKIIIDVRGNPGGLLNEVVKIVNFFIPKGKVVVTTKGRFKKYRKTYLTKTESLDEEIPLAILVDNNSASASEILSGSLQDYDRAVIIGDTTYGKGLVQRTFKLKYGTYMKQTISKYYIPSGRLIQKIDYWHRNKNGKPLLMSDNIKKQDYKTANGRIVHNLGGVIPDIVIENNINESLIKYLISKKILFDFSTWYYYNQPKPENADSFAFTNIDFELFIKYLHQHDINPKSTTEIMLSKAYEKAQKDNLDKSILVQYKKLLDIYTQADEKVLRKHKAQIIDLISRDLIYRYFYIDGYTKYIQKNDKVVTKAISILNNPLEYKKILGK